MHRRVQVEVEWFIALSDAGFAEFKPLSQGRARRCCAAWSRASREADAQAIKDIETHHQPRRQGGRVLAQGALRRPGRAAGRRRVRALRLHQRGHQQHQPRADAEGGARRGAAAGAGRLVAKLRAMAHAARRACRCSAARTARPRARRPSARRSPTSSRAWRTRARAHRRGAAAGQDERRGRQLQRAPRGLPGLRLGGVRAPRGREAARPGASTRTRSRSSRTTAWPSCSTRSRAPTPS